MHKCVCEQGRIYEDSGEQTRRDPERINVHYDFLLLTQHHLTSQRRCENLHGNGDSPPELINPPRICNCLKEVKICNVLAEEIANKVTDGA
jgi:hypothetical protein